MKLESVFLLLFGLLSTTVSFNIDNYFYQILKDDLGLDLKSVSCKELYENLNTKVDAPNFKDAHRLIALFTICLRYRTDKYSQEAINLIEEIGHTFKNKQLKELLPNFKKHRHSNVLKRSSIQGKLLTVMAKVIEEDLNLEANKSLVAINAFLRRIVEFVNVDEDDKSEVEFVKRLVFSNAVGINLKIEDFFERLAMCEKLLSYTCYESLHPGYNAILLMDKLSIFKVYSNRLDTPIEDEYLRSVTTFSDYTQELPDDFSYVNFGMEPFRTIFLIESPEEFAKFCQKIPALYENIMNDVRTREVMPLLGELKCYENRTDELDFSSYYHFDWFDLGNCSWALLPEQILMNKLNNRLVLSLSYTRVKNKEQLEAIEKFLGEEEKYLAIDGYFVTDPRIALPDSLFSYYKDLFDRKDTDEKLRMIAIIRMRQILYRKIRDSKELAINYARYINGLIVIYTNLIL